MGFNLSVTINGTGYSNDVEPRMLLVHYIRDVLNLTGTHVGCEHGVCGACTVLLDGVSVRSCLMFAVQADGREVTTVEGLADGDELHPLQEAFRDEHGLQCGFCTPGFVVAVRAFLNKNPDATKEEINKGLGGNLCRCGTYNGVLQAALDVAKKGGA